MGGGKPFHRRVEARPIEDENARRDEGSKPRREQVRVQFWRGRRNDRGRWERPAGVLRDAALGEAGSGRYLDRGAQERRPAPAQGDVEALKRRQYAYGLLPRIRVR